MPIRLLSMLLLLLVASLPLRAAPLDWSEVQARAQPAAGQRIAYGRAPSQFGDLRVPEGAGPHPVVVLLHGGCWMRGFGLDYFSHLADALTREAGVATWNVEYLLLGEPGGGWPGTLLDAAQGADHLRTLADAHRLDLDRVVSLGHSAGGQLALWLASRARLTPGSALYRNQPLALRGVVGLAPITDLEAYGEGSGSCNAAVDDLMGGSPRQQLGRYSQASPRAVLPLGIPQWLIQGADDPIVTARSVRAYAKSARDGGDTAELIEIAGAGHFEPALPGTAAWPAVLAAVKAALASGAAAQP
jgi:acetyl esterase/lipase